MYWQTKRQNKFGANKTTYGGSIYHSKKEADYAQELDLLVKVGEIKSWERQVPIELRVNGKKICTYTMDFITITKEGHEKWIEVKGFETPEWRLKWKLLDALFPDQDKEVVK
jgi:hypothetical protein